MPWSASAGPHGLARACAEALDAEQITALRDAAPDWFAVRGAACRGGRGGTVDIGRVKRAWFRC